VKDVVKDAGFVGCSTVRVTVIGFATVTFGDDPDRVKLRAGCTMTTTVRTEGTYRLEAERRLKVRSTYCTSTLVAAGYKATMVVGSVPNVRSSVEGCAASAAVLFEATVKVIVSPLVWTSKSKPSWTRLLPANISPGIPEM